jgi:NADH:quinone reductase (non-electrogenic)
VEGVTRKGNRAERSGRAIDNRGRKYSMNLVFRRSLVGMVAGGAASVMLLTVPEYRLLSVLFGIVIGALFSAGLDPTGGAYVDNLMTGAALGIPLWGLVSIIGIPLLSRQMPQWTSGEMRMHFPALIAWVSYGAFLGLFIQGLTDIAESTLGPERADASPSTSRDEKQIVILGGGFAGMRTAECLEKELQGIPFVRVTLVSDTNALLFTPMLAEVAGSSLEPSHISTPLRSSLPQTQFIRGLAIGVDLETRKVLIAGGSESGVENPRAVPFDHLVFALGSVSNHFGMLNVEKFAFNFKSLVDAIRIRNQVIDVFERADQEREHSLRVPLLTFVIAGGGFAGVELAGSINDFAHGILADYPNLLSEELRVVLVHSGHRILPELSESLGNYAQLQMEARGVKFRMNTRVADVQPGIVTLSDGEIPCHTLVWTAGTAPHPLLKSLPLEKDKRGTIAVDDSLNLAGDAQLWALGDCAAVLDTASGKSCPPTAQFARREAEVLARNIRAHFENRPKERFHFESLGALCVIGHQTACAELKVPLLRKSLRFSGLFAWLLWRGIYLSKLPGLERKIRVLVDWTIELFFPRDIVQTIDLR